jgi:hypothetical protein
MPFGWFYFVKFYEVEDKTLHPIMGFKELCEYQRIPIFYERLRHIFSLQINNKRKTGMAPSE